jgi:hypothetical protein
MVVDNENREQIKPAEAPHRVDLKESKITNVLNFLGGLSLLGQPNKTWYFKHLEVACKKIILLKRLTII